MGGLHKDAGSYGFNGSARLSRRAAQRAAGFTPASSTRLTHPQNRYHDTNPPCSPRPALIPSATFLPPASHAARTLSSQRRFRAKCDPHPTQSDKPERSRVSPTGCILAALALCLAAATGCSNIQSQAANVEGVRLYQQGNYQQASDRFQQAIAQNPKSPEGYYNLAASLHKTGTLYNRPSDLQQAENLYNQCLERDPNHTECYRGLAVLLNETGRQQEAFKLLNHWSNANPKSADPKIEVARLLEESGQQEQAKEQLVDALTIDPHNARALTALGRLRDHGMLGHQMSASIKAIVYHAHGKPEEVLRLEEQTLPAIAADQALVRMLAAPINPADLNAIEGKYPIRPELPAIPGMEGAGVVVETRRSRQRPRGWHPGSLPAQFRHVAGSRCRARPTSWSPCLTISNRSRQRC